MSRLQLLRSYLARRERLPWWWVVGNSLVFLLAILLGDAVEDDHHRGLDFKSLAVGLVVILVGNAILAGAVVLAVSRRAEHEEDVPRPRRDR
jgi:drug/metabolite transporter (DMT)-like permease